MTDEAPTVPGHVGISGSDAAGHRDTVREIDKNLLDLQAEPGGTATDRYRDLISARAILTGGGSSANDPGTDLMAIPRRSWELAIASIASASASKSKKTPGNAEAKRMQKHAVVAKTKATSDFRKSRSLPLGGLAGLTGAVWGTRETFGVNLTDTGTIVWSLVSLYVISVAVIAWVISARHTRRDERYLRRLYDTSTQGFALETAAARRSRYGAEVEFDRHDFARARWDHSTGGRHGEEVEFDRHDFARALWDHSTRGRRRIAPSILSTVDLESALDDASNLALERFMELKLVEAVYLGPIERIRLVGTVVDQTVGEG